MLAFFQRRCWSCWLLPEQKSKNWSWLIVGHQPSCKWDISPHKPLLVFITQVVIIEQKTPIIAKIHVSKRFSVRKFHYLMGMHPRHSMGLVYLPTFGDIWLIFMGSVGNYTIRWVFGHISCLTCKPVCTASWGCRILSSHWRSGSRCAARDLW